jgi:VWFA-related protein
MIRNPIHRLIRRLLAAFLIAGSLLAAQQNTGPAQEQDASGLSIRRTVRRVIVDVVVTDAAQKPVSELDQHDFSITEDGKSQQVLSFNAHNLDPEFAPPKMAAMPPNTFVNVPSGPERGPLYVVLLDLVNTEMVDQPIARRNLLQFIDAKPQGTRFAVFVLSDGLYLTQGFTDDHALLAAAVDPAHPKSHIPRIFIYGNNYGKGNTSLMVEVFGDIAHFLDGLPGRKNLIWLSGGFPMSLAPSDGNPADLEDDVKDVLNTMARGQVAVYPIDVRGITVDNVHTGAVSGGPGGATTVGTSELYSQNLDEAGIAGATGGHAFFNSNDIKGALNDAIDIGSNYYTLSYSPTNPTYDGKVRHISVLLAKKGYRLSYRREYYADDPDSPRHIPKKEAAALADAVPAASHSGDSLYAYMQRGAPMAHQLYFRAHVHALGPPAMGTPQQMANLEDQPAYFHVRRKNRPVKPLAPIKLQTYAIDYTVVLRQSNATTAAGTPQPHTLEFAVAAFDANSRMLNGIAQDATGSTPRNTQEANPEQFYRVQQQIDVPLSAVALRIAVREAATDHLGAMEVALPLAAEPQASAEQTTVKSN